MNASKSWEIHRVQSVFLIIAATIAVAAFAFAWMYQFIPPKALPSVDLIIDAYKSFVLPKPKEQFVFVLLAGAAPILVYAVAFSPFRHTPSGAAEKFQPILAVGLLFAPLLFSDFVTAVIGEYDKPRLHGGLALIGAAVVAALMSHEFLSLSQGRVRSLQVKISAPILWGFFLSAVALQLASWRLVSITSVTRDGYWSTHADPIFYALSQVVAGKTLMVDLPSQYGLFPEIIGPLFKLIGLSVLKLSVFFAVLQALSLAALYSVLSRNIKIKPLLIVTGLALVLLTFETTLHIAGIDERYYQYWPTRFFWPAISLFAFQWFLAKRNLTRTCIVSLIGAIGLLWNLDSGLFITVVFAAYLVGRLVTALVNMKSWRVAGPPADAWRPTKYIVAIGLHVSVTVAVIVTFLMAMSWKAGEPLNWFWLLAYQKIFYSLGLMMLPLPNHPDPWMSILGVYLIGLISALVAWRARHQRAKDDMLFYLSMLGLGLFVYYEGRSHVLNLITVCWPAAVLIAIFADQSLRSIRAGLIPKRQICIPIASLSFLLLACCVFLMKIPSFLVEASREYKSRGVIEEPFVANEIDFIKAHSIESRKCLIVSQRQGIYHAETGLASPVEGPGLVEILLKSDEQKFVSDFLTGHLRCVFYGVGGYTDAGLKIPMEEILAHYVVRAKNSDSTMLYLEPKQ